jgi:hypothetical protein
MEHPRRRSLTASIAAARHRAPDRRCRVTNVFDVGDALAIFVAPIAELAFDRRHPIADCRRRRAQAPVADRAS